MLNKLHLLITVSLILTSTQVLSKPSGENPPPIEVDVFVVNDGANPVPVTIQGQSQKEVVNQVEQDSIGSSDVNTLPVDLFIVPVGKRLVITSAAVDTGLNLCSFTLNPRIRLTSASAPVPVMFPLGAVPASVLGLSTLRYINQVTYPVNIYAGPEDIVRFDLFRSNDGCPAIVRLSISGYLEDDI